MDSTGISNLANTVETVSTEGNFQVMAISLVLLIGMSAFFSATETAFTCLNLLRLKTKADSGSKRARKTLELAEDYDKLLSTILIGNNIVNILATTVSTLLFTQISKEYGAAISTTVLTIVILIFGEVSPKSLAKEFPEKIAMFSTPFIRILTIILKPAVSFFTNWRKLLSKIFVSNADEGITDEELVNLVGQAEEEGGLEVHEGQLIRAAIAFNDMEVAEILTPRVDLKVISDTDDWEKVADTFLTSGYSRLPVYHETIDNIVGVIHEKDFNIARHSKQDITQWIELQTPVLYTTARTPIFQLLRVLQQNKAHLSVVVDSFGGTEGIITLEDILEELVGEIWDEHDEIIEKFTPQEDGSYIVNCTTDLDELFQLFSLTDESQATTVAGWVLEKVGNIPVIGDCFSCGGLEVTVTNTENRRVLEVRVVPLNIARGTQYV